MDMIYTAAPALACAIFTALAITTDPKQHSVMRTTFLLSALASLVVFMGITQTISLYGEMVVDGENTTYTYNGTVLESSNSTFNYTHVSPITASAYDGIWLVMSAVIWLVFAYVIITLLLNTLEWITSLFRKGGED